MTLTRITTLVGIIVATATFAPSTQAADVVDTAAANPQFSTLVKLVKAAGLVDALKTTEGITVFAPTNAAFAKLPKSTLAMLAKPENKAKLAAILKYHVVPKKIMAKDMMAVSGSGYVKYLSGESYLRDGKPGNGERCKAYQHRHRC